jgi:hypothetical protein
MGSRDKHPENLFLKQGINTFPSGMNGHSAKKETSIFE